MARDIVAVISRVSPSAHLGRGVILMRGARVYVDSVIGDIGIINGNSSRCHHASLETGVSIGPGVTFPGTVTCLEPDPQMRA